MKVLITGGLGFLGRHLTQELLRHRDGIEIHLLSRRSFSESSVIHHKGDIRVLQDVNDVVRKVSPDWIFHLAADLRRDRDARLHRELMSTNVNGTLNLLSAASEIPIKAFVAVGSFEEYGNAPVPFAEDGPLLPASPYGASKAAASLAVITYGKNVIPATVIRFPLVYGFGQTQPSFMSKTLSAYKENHTFLMSPGDQTREFLHVDDAVRALVRGAENVATCSGEAINVCRSEEISMLAVGDLIAQVTGRSNLIRFGMTPHRANEQMRYVGLNHKMKLLSFEPEISLEQGIRRLFVT